MSRSNYGTVGERIRRARSRLGITTRELAERCDVSNGQITRWELDRVLPRLDEATALCAVLDIPIGWLIEGIGATSMRYAFDPPTDLSSDDPAGVVQW